MISKYFEFYSLYLPAYGYLFTSTVYVIFDGMTYFLRYVVLTDVTIYLAMSYVLFDIIMYFPYFLTVRLFNVLITF